MSKIPQPYEVAAQLQGFYRADANPLWLHAVAALVPERKRPKCTRGVKSKDDRAAIETFREVIRANPQASVLEAVRIAVAQEWPGAATTARYRHGARIRRKLRLINIIA